MSQGPPQDPPSHDPPPPDVYRSGPSARGRADAAPSPRRDPSATSLTLGDGFRPNTIFSGFGWAVAAFLSLQLLGVGALLIVNSDPSDKAETLTALIVTLIVDVVALALVPIFVLGGYYRSLPALGLRRPTMGAVGWAVTGLGLAYVTLGIYAIFVDLINVDALEPVSTINDDVIYEHIHLVVLTGILAVIVAPVTEEIFYRGFLVGGLARRWGVPAGIVLSSALFSVVHLDVGSLIPFAIIGIIFASIYVRSGHLSAAIYAHFLFNLIGYVGTVIDEGVG